MLKRLLFSSFLMALSLAMPSLSQAETALPKELENLSEEQLNESIEFIMGNAIFVLFHEAGHMLISELGLPVLGKEEDAVDTLSSILLLEAADDTLNKALTDSADGWFLSGSASEEAGDEYAFWGEHSVDQQRAYAIVCMMVGKDPEVFKHYADTAELPESRRERCAGDYESALASWQGVLEPHTITNGSTSKLAIMYDEPAMDELVPYAEIIKGADLLSLVQVAIGDVYQLAPDIQMRATTCGEPNAFWDPGKRELTFCYELAQFHAGLVSNYFANEADKAQ